jgi:hypothetical protein
VVFPTFSPVIVVGAPKLPQVPSAIPPEVSVAEARVSTLEAIPESASVKSVRAIA